MSYASGRLPFHEGMLLEDYLDAISMMDFMAKDKKNTAGILFVPADRWVEAIVKAKDEAATMGILKYI
jgi:hypothetical protein